VNHLGGDRAQEQIADGTLIDTLEALQVAVNDGRLESVPSISLRRVEAIPASLCERLGHRHIRALPPHAVPAVALLLSVDNEYRAKARAGELRMTAPKRFNPIGETWLPVLHARRGDWHFTALFSNTPRAHELGKTREWVVIYFHLDAEPSRNAPS
jgi:hypothetical protein